MYVSPEWKKRLWIAAGAAPLFLPGWRGELVPVPHEEILMDAQNFDADEIVPASRRGDVDGEQWDISYMGSRWAAFFDLMNLRGFATHVVPPKYVAHRPPGPDHLPERADAWFRVDTSVRWPWWWPGGGVDWRLPAR